MAVMHKKGSMADKQANEVIIVIEQTNSADLCE